MFGRTTTPRRVGGLLALTLCTAACGANVKFTYQAVRNAKNIEGLPGGTLGNSVDPSTAMLRAYKLTSIDNSDGDADFKFNARHLYTCQEEYVAGDKPVCAPPPPSGCPEDDPSKCNCKMDNLLLIRNGKNADYVVAPLNPDVQITVPKGQEKSVNLGMVFTCKTTNGEEPASGATDPTLSWTPLRYYDDHPSFVFLPDPWPDPKYNANLDAEKLP